MRDIYEILEFCAAEDAMDYCPEFDDVKATLEFCDQNVKPFKKLVFRSGNESIINELTRRLQDSFLERHLIDDVDRKPLKEAHQKLRKILMFLFANTDATYKYNLRDDSNFVHLIEICPLLPKFLTVALVWELNLESFFYEALAYTPCWFAFQYFEAANESLKYIEDANKVLSVIEELLRSLLINIERSAKLNMDAVDQKIIFNKLYDQAAILLRRFNTPDANLIEKMKKRQLYRYSGYKIKHLLQLVTFAFDLYESKYEHSLDFDGKVYTIGEIFHKQSPKHATNKRANKDEELRITHTLLSTLQNCVMSVKMDDFIEWADVYLTPTMLLQQAIGEMAFHVRKRIMANASFEHSVEGMLKTIEIHPKSFAEILAEANIGQILRTLDDDTDLKYETKKQWFDELFKRGEETLGNVECLQTMAEHIDLMTIDNCQQIIRFIQLRREVADFLISNEEEEEKPEFEELNILLLFGAFENFPTESILEVLLYQQKIFGESNNSITVDSEDFAQRSTEFLNKCTTIFDLHEFLMLCFQQPQQMWSKFFDSACNSIEQMRHFSETVLKTLPYSFVYVDKLIKEAVLKQTHQPVYFPELLSEMYFILYRNEHKVEFLSKFINDHMKKCLDANDYNSLIPIVKALFLISQKNDILNFDELSAPMLAMVAVVADLSRWNFNTFSSVRVELVELCTKFITVTLSRLLITATEKDRKWLISKLKSTCGPLTQFYFQRILNQTGEIEIPFDRFVCTEDIQDGPKIVKFLHKILVRCTGVEFQSLAGSPRFTPYLTEAMQQIIITVNSDSNPNAMLNLSYCLTEYMNAVNEIMKPKCQTADEIYELLHGILALIAPVSDKIYGQVFMETVSLLKEIVLDSSINLSKDKLTELMNFVVEMPDCTAKNIILQTLKNSISN